jgi:queuine tRNA-ribosyltransferase
MFELLKTDGEARLGRLHTERGIVHTPQFMPVGTQGTVRALTPHQLKDFGAEIILGNTYHLNLRPGMNLIRKFKGLHRFISWDRPILTDSGGFQVFSLSKLRTITERGVHFKSHIDGSPLFLGPCEATQIQMELGSDIMMAFDECPPWPCDEEAMKGAVERTIRWGKICLEERDRQLDLMTDRPTKKPLLFGIVQGGGYSHWRAECAKRLVELPFDGFAIGGVSVGEPEHEMYKAVEYAIPHLPTNHVRYTMGLGQPNQLVELVARGVDIFDCVLPTRIARHCGAYTRDGTINLRNAPFREDERPIEEGCSCYACQNFSRAYIRHLLKSDEVLGLMLVTMHNVHFYLRLMKEIREAITENRFDSYRREFLTRYKTGKDHETNAIVH